ncbi:MAG: hypothetical protein RR772_09745, partial [Gordonibacter sp.]
MHFHRTGFERIHNALVIGDIYRQSEQHLAPIPVDELVFNKKLLFEDEVVISPKIILVGGPIRFAAERAGRFSTMHELVAGSTFALLLGHADAVVEGLVSSEQGEAVDIHEIGDVALFSDKLIDCPIRRTFFVSAAYKVESVPGDRLHDADFIVFGFLA